ncbi:LamG-like jellyroll fold domain-containing protein [Pleionea sediminis]|uniref:LamG-like jellyroll fold domain-containing protein n=1 Tax=Pleionea sediminis TaxID=2569479 RepID=UPI001184F883|nr:LamG-like jellyroll fold domain-containing protein [Pleionea sediminis]
MKPFQLDDWLVEPEKNLISYDGDTIHIEPRVMAVLVCLVNNLEQTVSREKLIEEAWPDRIVGDGSLNRCIAILRKTFDKSGTKQSVIKTIPKKGYLLSTSVDFGLKKTLRHSNKLGNVSQEKTSSRSISNIYWLIPLVTTLSVSLFFIEIKPGQSKSKEPIQKSSENEYVKVFKETTLVPGSPTGVFCFDGVDDFVEVPSNSDIDVGVGDFSLSVWVKTHFDGIGVILDKRVEDRLGNVLGYNLHLHNGEPGMQLADGEGEWYCSKDTQKSSCTNFSSGKAINDGLWHHVVVSVDRDHDKGLKFFIDGKLVSSTNASYRQRSLSNPSALRIGSRSSSITGLFPVEIQGVQIFNRALNHQDIEKLINAVNPNDCKSSLIGY